MKENYKFALDNLSKYKPLINQIVVHMLEENKRNE